MGSAGLDIAQFGHALARRRIDLEVIEDDRLWDHCLMRLQRMRYPHEQAWICYENIGIEPRLVSMWLGALPFDDFGEARAAGALGGHLAGGMQLALEGSRQGDVEKIAGWVAAHIMGTAADSVL